MCWNVFTLFISYVIAWLGIEFLVGRTSFRPLNVLVLLYCFLAQVLLLRSLVPFWFTYPCMWSVLFCFSLCGSFRFSSLNPVLLNILIICFVMGLRFQLLLRLLSSLHSSNFHNFYCSTSLPAPFLKGLLFAKPCTLLVMGLLETEAVVCCAGFLNFCFVTTCFIL